MNQALIGQRTYQVPGRFVELSPAQYLGVVELLHAGLAKLELKLRLTMVLLEVRHRPLLFAQLQRMSSEQRYELTQLADFCLEEPRFTKQLLPEVRVPGARRTKLHGPADAFGNLSFAEFIQAEGHFFDYQRQPEERHLNLFVATLYRPAGGKNPADRREAYVQGDVAGRAALVARLPLATRLAVRMWYSSCRGAYVRKYTGSLFTAPTGDGSTRPRDPRETWREILAERAGSPVNYEEYGLQPLPNIFFDLDLRVRRKQEQTPSN
jgi:hypothetical protein